jgi:hypothetical protein
VNVTQLVAAWLAAVCAYFLIHRVCSHRGAAFLGGLAFAFAPFRFVHLSDHLNLVHTAFLPLGLLLFLRYLDRPTRAAAVWLGISLGAAFLTDPQLAVLAAACIIPVAIVERDRLAASWKGLVLGVVAALVVAAPLLLPMISGLGSGEGNRSRASALVVYSSDPTRWVVPPSSHRTFGGLARTLLGEPPDEGLAYAGLGVLVLAVCSLRWIAPTLRRHWTAVFVCGFVLSLGPLLSLNGDYVRIPLPFMALRLVPGLDALRVPGRFSIVGILALDVLAALAMVDLSRRWPRRAALLFGLAVAVLAVDLYPARVVSRSADVPAPYEALADAPGSGAVLELPLQWSTGEIIIGDQERDDSIFMTYATVHGRPIVSGSVSRYSNDRLDQMLAIPVYRQVLALQGEPGYHEVATFDGADLAALGISHVVYHRDRPHPEVLAHMDALGLPVLADDGTVVVWSVSSA